MWWRADLGQLAWHLRWFATAEAGVFPRLSPRPPFHPHRGGKGGRKGGADSHIWLRRFG